METLGEKSCDYNYKDKSVSEITACCSSAFPATIENCVNKIIKKEGYSNYKVTKRQVSTDGGNYLGILYEVDIEGKTKDGKDKEDHLFMKHVVVSEVFKMLDVCDIYRRELFAYTELSRIFNQIQDEANVPIEERYKIAKVYEQSNTEVIILENMVNKGFTTKNRMDGITIDFAELSVIQLARLHSLSLVLKHKRPDYFEKKLKPLKCTFSFNDEWHKSTRHLCNLAIEPLGYDDKLRAQKFIDRVMTVFANYSTDTTLPGCTMCHGDYRANNILTKEVNGVSVEVVPVDYQLIYYGCPVMDFLYFIFTGTDQSFRAKHLEDLIDLYHDTLGKFLKYFDLNVENIYSRKEFDKQYEEKLDMGLAYGLLIMSFIFAEVDDIPDISQEIDKLTVKMNKKFETRVQGLIDDFKNWGRL